MQLFVKTLAGKTISIEVDNDATVGDVVAKAKAEGGITDDELHLSLDGKPLAVGSSLADHNIEGGTLLSQVSQVAQLEAPARPTIQDEHEVRLK